MPYGMYVASQGDDKIVRFAMDAATGALEPQGEVVVPGGPAPIAVDPGRQWLYVARRGECKISSYRIDQRTGALGLLGTVELPTDPCYLATDRRGKFLLADPDRSVGEIFVCPKPRAQQHRWFCRRRCHRTLEVDRAGCKRARAARLQPRSRGQVPLCRWPRIGPACRIPYRSEHRHIAAAYHVPYW